MCLGALQLGKKVANLSPVSGLAAAKAVGGLSPISAAGLMGKRKKSGSGDNLSKDVALSG